MMKKLATIAAMSALAACGTKDAPDPLSPSGATGRVRFVNVITDTTRGRVNAILEGVPFGVNLTYGLSTPATLPAPSTANYSAILTGARSLVLKRTADTNTVIASMRSMRASGASQRPWDAEASSRFQSILSDATLYPGKPARSIACCTNPVALACSMNSLMYASRAA